QEGAFTAGNAGNHPVGLVRQRPAARAAGQLRRHRRHGNHDAQSQPNRSGTTIEQIKKMRTDYPGRGPHTITGPIYIEGAEPGDVLKVTINRIVPRAYAANFNVPGMFGQFPKDYADGQVKYFYVDWDKKITEFLPGIEIPLKPFPGILGVARK